MAIRVYCDCGRKLTVPDEQAGRRTKCPVCGAVVSVPKRKAERKPRESVLTEEFITGGRSDEETGNHPDAIDQQVTFGSHTATADGTKPRRKAKRRRPRTSWSESLMVPIDHLGFILLLSFLGAVGAALFVGVLQSELSRPEGIGFIRLFATFVFTLLLTTGLACEFLSFIAAEASQTATDQGRWTLVQLEDAAVSTMRFALCFVCGPLFPIGFAAWYWVHWGAVTALDRIILFEAFGLAAGWGAFQILLTSRRPLEGMLPVPVARAILHLGWRSLIIFIGMGVLAGLLVQLWHPAMVASSRGFHWSAFRLWFLIHVLALTGTGILIDLLGGWYARFVEPPRSPRPSERRAKSLAPPIATPEPIPESTVWH